MKKITTCLGIMASCVAGLSLLFTLSSCSHDGADAHAGGGQPQTPDATQSVARPVTPQPGEIQPIVVGASNATSPDQPVVIVPTDTPPSTTLPPGVPPIIPSPDIQIAGDQPVPETTAYAPDDYIYYPGYAMYYGGNHHQYHFQQHNAWVAQASPVGVTPEVLHASASVKMDFHDAPALHHAAVVQQYPKNWAPSDTHAAQPAPHSEAPHEERK